MNQSSREFAPATEFTSAANTETMLPRLKVLADALPDLPDAVEREFLSRLVAELKEDVAILIGESSMMGAAMEYRFDARFGGRCMDVAAGMLEEPDELVAHATTIVASQDAIMRCVRLVDEMPEEYVLAEGASLTEDALVGMELLSSLAKGLLIKAESSRAAERIQRLAKVQERESEVAQPGGSIRAVK